jgi:hypothetical protein
MIDTKKSPGFRQLRFNSVDECVAEIDRIVEAEREGRLRTTGNWTAGQILGHLASWIEFGYAGYPIAPPPFFIRWILRWKLKQMLQKGMPRGVRIPGNKDGTVGIEDVPFAAAAERLVNGFRRLQRGEDAKFDSPAFGPMPHDDRIRLNLRHAELHLGYISY